MRIRPAYISTAKVAAVGLLGWGAYQGWSAYQLQRFEFKPVTPTEVSLIAVSPNSGYRIVVSNSVARLVQGSAQFGAPDQRDADAPDEKSQQNIIPIRDMVNGMKGDADGLSNFVMRLNNLDENDLPPVRHVWTEEMLIKALKGDADLKRKLERQLNVTIKGAPLDQIDRDAMEFGIVLDIVVPIKFKIAGKETTVNAHVLESYRPQFPQVVLKSLEDDAKVSDESLLAEYLRQSNVMREKNLQENVAESLLSRFTADRLASLAAKPERVLHNTETILTSDHLTSARVESESDNSGTVKYSLQLGVTEEGRMRLWKYSRAQSGYQLLLVSNGVAVAAPRIEGDVFTHELAIRNLTDEPLARQTAELIETLKRN